MSAPISASTSRATGLAGADSARPQMQSRRVSLKLGPFGITYSTDQVLWTAAAAEAAATATETAAASTQADPFDSTGQAKAQASSPSQQAQQAQTEAQQAGRTFSQEMLDAWRRQVEERVQAVQTYGPGAARGSNAGGGKNSSAAEGAVLTSSDAAGQASSSAAPGAMPAESPAAASGSPGARTEQGTGSRAAQSSATAPVSRVRKAISAYLACAQSFRTTSPMLTAVA